MKIHGIEKMSLVDYDGKVAATLFTADCNFRCPFCHNAALVLDAKKIDPIPLSDVFSYLSKRVGILDGVCVTGGEPTLQKDLPEFLKKIKDMGYSVKLDTNGTSPEAVKTIAENGLADYFAVDIKNCPEKYAATVGFDKYDLKKVEQTVSYLLSGSADYEFRTTLIKEFHDEKDMEKIGLFIKGAKRYFLQKFKSGDNCISPDGLSPVEKENAEKFANVLKNYVHDVKLRGYDI